MTITELRKDQLFDIFLQQQKGGSKILNDMFSEAEQNYLKELHTASAWLQKEAISTNQLLEQHDQSITHKKILSYLEKHKVADLQSTQTSSSRSETSAASFSEQIKQFVEKYFWGASSLLMTASAIFLIVINVSTVEKNAASDLYEHTEGKSSPKKETAGFKKLDNLGSENQLKRNAKSVTKQQNTHKIAASFIPSPKKIRSKDSTIVSKEEEAPVPPNKFSDADTSDDGHTRKKQARAASKSKKISGPPKLSVSEAKLMNTILHKSQNKLGIQEQRIEQQSLRLERNFHEAQQLFQMAHKQLKQNKYKQAIESFLKAKNLDLNLQLYFLPLAGIAESYFHLKEYQKSWIYYQRALNLFKIEEKKRQGSTQKSQLKEEFLTVQLRAAQTLIKLSKNVEATKLLKTILATPTPYKASQKLKQNAKKLLLRIQNTHQ